MNSRMVQVIQIVGAILEHDVTVVIVVPTNGPTFVVPKRITAVLKAVIPAGKLRMSHVERVALPEMRSVIGIGDASVLPAAVPGRDLGALWLYLACRLSTLGRCLGTLWLGFFRALRFSFLCVLLWRGLFCALWFSFLGVLLWCSLLRMLWLRLMLRLRWFSAAALFLLAFLGEYRNGHT